jgi:hypothetical protein
MPNLIFERIALIAVIADSKKGGRLLVLHTQHVEGNMLAFLVILTTVGLTFLLIFV